jgi:hypothetical protein
MRRLTTGIAVALVLFCGVLLLTNVLPTRREYRELDRRHDALLQRKERLEEERVRQELLADALKNDPMTVERTLRTSLRHSQPGERVIREDNR